MLVFIDDATSKLMQMRFVPSESTDSYFAALEGYVNDHGCPVAFYSDKHTVFRVNKPNAKGGPGMTQFGRALAELNIEILCANSSQAKGRVERANRTLQDRLVKELRLADISDMSSGNAFLPGFMERFNEKFSLPAVKAENLHRRLNLPATRLADILCHREQRHVGQQLTLAYDRRQIILERSDVADGLAGQYVEIYDFADRPLEVRWKGHSLPYRVFNKDQRVSHTAIVENKRLRHALATVKAQQDIKRLPKIMTNSEKIGYKRRPRQVYGPDTLLDGCARYAPRCRWRCRPASRSSSPVSYSCHVMPSTPGAALRFKEPKLSLNRSIVTWWSRAVNFISLCSLVAFRTPASPCDTRPALCRARVGLMSVLLDQRPFLLTLRHRLLDFVRMIHR